MHRHAPLDHGVDVRPELAAGERVDAGGRLVEKQHRPGRACTAQASASRCLKPSGSVAGIAAEVRARLERVDQPGRSLPPPARRDRP